MEFTSFTALVQEEVKKRAGEKYNVRVNDVRKNNGVVLSGLIMTNDDSNISPTIYLNNYYEAYEEGRITLLNVVNDVMDTYNRNMVDKSVDMRYFLHYENVKDRIIYKLVNTAQNKELLKDVPHIEFFDLSIVFQCLIASEEFGNATIMVHDAHLKLWDVSVEDLYKAAKANTPRLQECEIKSMNDVITEISQSGQYGEIEYGLDDVDMEEDISMYVLSNKNRVEGAACFLYPSLLKDFSKAVDSSFYVIPSSIHELLLLLAQDSREAEAIKIMIKEINDTHVKTEEVLSYSLYFFDKKNGKVLLL